MCRSGVGQRGTQDALFELPTFVTAPNAYEAPLSTREIVLLALWTFYRKPCMQRISNAVPYALRQKIKRQLTKRPLHEIVDVSKN
ncbi:hypothetical protein D3C84_1235840 [compost metagenome]